MVERTCEECGTVTLCKSLKGVIPCRTCRPPTPCAIDGCELPARGRGWCITHYSRWRKHGNPFTIAASGRQRLHVGCSIDGCDKPHGSRGWCRQHYERWKSHGDPYWEPPIRLADCQVQDCNEPTSKRAASGFCITHYKRLQKYGDPRGVQVICCACALPFYPVNSLRKSCPPCAANRNHGTSAAELANRDGATCRLCDEPVDMTLKFPHPESGSVDHIHPWSLGGGHQPENLQLAHLGCNMRKSNRLETA